MEACARDVAGLAYAGILPTTTVKGFNLLIVPLF